MGRKIPGIITGYLTMAVFVFLTFTVLYLILGADGTFNPGTYRVSATWIIFSLILSIIAAVLGGFVTSLIAKDKNAAYILAGVVLILGIILAIPAMNVPEEELNKVRSGNVPNMEAMQSARQPSAILLLNPIIGALGVLAGSGFRKGKKV